jgi:hypothetical protein
MPLSGVSAPVKAIDQVPRSIEPRSCRSRFQVPGSRFQDQEGTRCHPFIPFRVPRDPVNEPGSVLDPFGQRPRCWLNGTSTQSTVDSPKLRSLQSSRHQHAKALFSRSRTPRRGRSAISGCRFPVSGRRLLSPLDADPSNQSESFRSDPLSSSFRLPLCLSSAGEEDEVKAGQTKTKWAAADGGRRAGYSGDSPLRNEWAIPRGPRAAGDTRSTVDPRRCPTRSLTRTSRIRCPQDSGADQKSGRRHQCSRSVNLG